MSENCNKIVTYLLTAILVGYLMVGAYNMIKQSGYNEGYTKGKASVRVIPQRVYLKLGYSYGYHDGANNPKTVPLWEKYVKEGQVLEDDVWVGKIMTEDEFYK